MDAVCCAAGFLAGLCPVRVNRVASRRSRRSWHVRYASNSDPIGASPRSVAMCHFQTHALQQRNISFEGQAYFASLAAFWIRAATSFGCERKIAWLP